MKLAIDANIVFAAFIKDNQTRKIILNRNFELFAPDFVLEEVEKYSDYIRKKSKITDMQFKHLKELIFAQISVVPKKYFSKFMIQARKISPDKNDAQYFALALKMKTPIWSNDSKLKKQGKIKILNTSGIIDCMEKLKKREISIQKAAEILGATFSDMLDLMAQEKIDIGYTINYLEKDTRKNNGKPLFGQSSQ